MASLEQYYTPDSIAKAIVEKLKPLIPDFEELAFVDPSAGEGAFLRALVANGVKPENIVAYDIDPKPSKRGLPVEILQADFLKMDVSEWLLPKPELEGKKIAVISSPPFGIAHKLSIPFFFKLAERCDYVGLLSPRAWKRERFDPPRLPDLELIWREDQDFEYITEDGTRVAITGWMPKVMFSLWRQKDIV